MTQPRSAIRRILDILVQPVPPELDLCESCRVTHCSDETFEHCEMRLRQQRALVETGT